MMKSDSYPSGKKVLALFSGLIIGAVAGLIGVGGGEFRIPVLLYVLGLPVLTAITVNLLVGLLTIVVSFLIRLSLVMFDVYLTSIVLAMSLGSVFGSYSGALTTRRVPERPLRIF